MPTSTKKTVPPLKIKKKLSNTSLQRRRSSSFKKTKTNFQTQTQIFSTPNYFAALQNSNTFDFNNTDDTPK